MLLAAVAEIGADEIRVKTPVPPQVLALTETFRLEVGNEPNIEYMRVDDVSQAAAGIFGVTREAEDAEVWPARRHGIGAPVRVTLTAEGLRALIAELAGGDSELPAFASPADDGKTIGWLAGAWQKVTQVTTTMLDDAVAAVLESIGLPVHNDPVNYPYEYVQGLKDYEHAVVYKFGMMLNETAIAAPTEAGTEPLQIWENTSGAQRNLQLGLDAPQSVRIIQNAQTSTSPISLTGAPPDIVNNPATTILNPGDTVICWFNGTDSWRVMYLPPTLDADLAVIANMTPSNDDVLQRKSGNWASRTLAQLKTDLQPLTWTFATLVTGTSGFISNGAGSLATPAYRIIDAASGLRRSAANAWRMTMNGIDTMGWTSTSVTSYLRHRFEQAVSYKTLSYNTYSGGFGAALSADIANTTTLNFSLLPGDAAALLSQYPAPFIATISNGLGNSETVLVDTLSATTGNGTIKSGTRGVFGTTAAAALVADGATIDVVQEGLTATGGAVVAAATHPSIISLGGGETDVLIPVGLGGTPLASPSDGQIMTILDAQGDASAAPKHIKMWTSATSPGYYTDITDIDTDSGAVQLIFVQGSTTWKVIGRA